MEGLPKVLGSFSRSDRRAQGPGGAGVYDKGIVEARASRDHAPTLQNQKAAVCVVRSTINSAGWASISSL
jgi:hypothetical protein